MSLMTNSINNSGNRCHSVCLGFPNWSGNYFSDYSLRNFFSMFLHLFLCKSSTFLLGEKKPPNKTYLKCLCVCFAKSRGDPSFMLLFLCASIVILCELLAPFNEAVLTVTPWAGKCYYIHFTGRELKHIGTK